ncbi:MULTISPECIES: hypothetical protein [Streptomyces]|nr:MULTISPECIES: hypothetical protein [Streptomyces]UUA07030.1 hypothetical protein NNW98_16465 [Streptomyces koelreuteriae]UUA14659.1 hypothetical protein NNW99_16460 [Streptomyces sp. CRCS-T-1]
MAANLGHLPPISLIYPAVGYASEVRQLTYKHPTPTWDALH